MTCVSPPALQARCRSRSHYATDNVGTFGLFLSFRLLTLLQPRSASCWLMAPLFGRAAIGAEGGLAAEGAFVRAAGTLLSASSGGPPDSLCNLSRTSCRPPSRLRLRLPRL